MTWRTGCSPGTTAPTARPCSTLMWPRWPSSRGDVRRLLLGPDDRADRGRRDERGGHGGAGGGHSHGEALALRETGLAGHRGGAGGDLRAGHLGSVAASRAARLRPARAVAQVEDLG